MVNKKLFGSQTPLQRAVEKTVPTDTVNKAGGSAYKYTPKHALAQIVCTGTFNGSYYNSAGDCLNLVKEATNAVNDPVFVAKAAVYASKQAKMKDMPSYLLARLGDMDKKLFRKVFDRIVVNGKMLRNLVQIARSGQLGKARNLSASMYRRALNQWFNSKSPASLMRASIGNDPNFKDILKMARPKPKNEQYAELFRYFIGKEFSVEKLPEPVRSYELYKQGKTKELPNVDFRFLDSLKLGTKEWTQIASKANWQMLRMNLETFKRHGVLDDPKNVKMIAERLKDPEAVKNSNLLPYQLFMAYDKVTSSGQTPYAIVEALQEAMDVALENTPSIDGKVYVAVDVSGSMSSPVTGYRGTATTQVSCVSVAALFASAILKKNKEAVILPFDTRIHTGFYLNPRDSVLTNADKLRRFGGGGTNCSLVVEHLNQKNIDFDVLIYLSDNESWVESSNSWRNQRATATMSHWNMIKGRNPNAKMVCIDLQISDNSQVKGRDDILQVGGFSDTVFDVVSNYVNNGVKSEEDQLDLWVQEIEAISLEDADTATADEPSSNGESTD